MSRSTATSRSTGAEAGTFAARGAYLPIPFAVLAIAGLALWFSGGGESGEPTAGGLAGAAVLCVAMLCLLGFAAWLGRSTRALVRAGAAVLAVGGLVHGVENLLVLGPGRGGADQAAAVWQVIEALSPTAFAVLGLGAVLTGVGLAGPIWLRVWGVVSGVLGLLSGLSALVPALDLLPPVFNISLLAWLIVLGVTQRPRPGFSGPGL